MLYISLLFPHPYAYFTISELKRLKSAVQRDESQPRGDPKQELGAPGCPHAFSFKMEISATIKWLLQRPRDPPMGLQSSLRCYGSSLTETGISRLLSEPLNPKVSGHTPSRRATQHAIEGLHMCPGFQIILCIVGMEGCVTST